MKWLEKICTVFSVLVSLRGRERERDYIYCSVNVFSYYSTRDWMKVLASSVCMSVMFLALSFTSCLCISRASS